MTQEDEKSNAAEEIDRNLRRAYRQIAEEDVPDRFAELLQKLREAEATQEPGKKGRDKRHA